MSESGLARIQTPWHSYGREGVGVPVRVTEAEQRLFTQEFRRGHPGSTQEHFPEHTNVAGFTDFTADLVSDEPKLWELEQPNATPNFDKERPVVVDIINPTDPAHAALVDELHRKAFEFMKKRLAAQAGNENRDETMSAQEEELLTDITYKDFVVEIHKGGHNWIPASLYLNALAKRYAIEGYIPGIEYYSWLKKQIDDGKRPTATWDGKRKQVPLAAGDGAQDLHLPGHMYSNNAGEPNVIKIESYDPDRYIYLGTSKPQIKAGECAVGGFAKNRLMTFGQFLCLVFPKSEKRKRIAK